MNVFSLWSYTHQEGDLITLNDGSPIFLNSLSSIANAISTESWTVLLGCSWTAGSNSMEVIITSYRSQPILPLLSTSLEMWWSRLEEVRARYAYCLYGPTSFTPHRIHQWSSRCCPTNHPVADTYGEYFSSFVFEFQRIISIRGLTINVFLISPTPPFLPIELAVLIKLVITRFQSEKINFLGSLRTTTKLSRTPGQTAFSRQVNKKLCGCSHPEK